MGHKAKRIEFRFGKTGKLVLPVVIIVLCLMRKHLITALSWGILAGTAAGLLFGIYTVATGYGRKK